MLGLRSTARAAQRCQRRKSLLQLQLPASAASVVLQHRWLSSKSDADGPESVLPPHTKFRMPDLDFERISGGNAVVTLSKWHISESGEVKDGARMCEIDTPDLNFVLEAGDEGFVAKIFVQEGANVLPNQPLMAIVPDEAAIQPFLDALRAHPRAIEGYVEPVAIAESSAASGKSASSSSSSSSTVDEPEGSDVLRALQKLQKDGRFPDDKQLKVLKSLARKNDEQLLVTFKGSFPDEAFDENTFDKDFFVENALELADEALAKAAETATTTEQS